MVLETSCSLFFSIYAPVLENIVLLLRIISNQSLTRMDYCWTVCSCINLKGQFALFCIDQFYYYVLPCSSSEQAFLPAQLAILV